jgi:hypothetical protein
MLQKSKLDLLLKFSIQTFLPDSYDSYVRAIQIGKLQIDVLCLY